MKANFKFTLRTDQQRKDHTSPIFLRITSHHKVKYVSSGRTVHERFWNKERGQVRSSCPDWAELSQYLESFLNTARDKYRTNGFDIEAVNHSTITSDVLTFVDKLIESHDRTNQFRTRQKYVTLKNRLIEFAGRKIPFEKVNKSFVQEFDVFLRLSYANKTNTRIKYLDQLRRAVNLAIEEGVAPPNSFPRLKMRTEYSERRRLSIDEVEKLGQYEAPVGSIRYHARNMWLLSFYIGGSRFEDTVLLEWSHIKNGSIQFTMGKTGKPYQLTLLPEASAIINIYAERSGVSKYIFPMMPEEVTKEAGIVAFKQTVNYRNSLTNKELGIIAKDLGIEKFTFHSARHSIADYLRLKKVDVYSISKILRHSNLRTTEVYLKSLDSESVSREFAKAFEETT
jgi:integrase